MKKEIKDYLHLYLGCTLRSKTGFVKLLAVTAEIIPNTSWGIVVLNGSETYKTELGDYLPELRPLSDMTEEEIKEFIGWDKLNEMYVDVSFRKEPTGIVIFYGINAIDYIERSTHKVSFTEWSPKEWLWLLKNGFDLFGLIESGLAIDKTKLNSEQNVQVSDTTEAP